MRKKTVKVFAPASIANVGAGFDVLGVALHKPGDVIIAKRGPVPGLQFSVKTTVDDVPLSANDNLAAYVANNMMADLRPSFGIEMVLHKLMPIGSGLGSSAASCVASAMAVNALLAKPLQKYDLLPYALAGEQKISGGYHADNVAASLFGGGCIVRNENKLDIVPFVVHRSLTWVLVHPHYVIKTAEARRVLPASLPLHQIIQQLGNTSSFVLGLIQGNAKLIRKTMIDHIAEPVRREMVPGYSEMKQAALSAGAIGCAISGSGPSLFALTKSKAIAKKVALQMQKALKNATGLESDYYISTTNVSGAKILQEEAK